ncbi:hypothetical protein FJY84_02200 [Candidatus Bathyarchaeota archaeon]|nr:hypothetical protein [Candidatus Bathyarchaeota archaeon]
MYEFLIPIIMSLLAGLSTGIGGLMVYAFGQLEGKFLGFLMGFAGGVMIVVSFTELFIEALDLVGIVWTVGAFAVGSMVMMGLDLLLPHIEFGQWEDGIKDKLLLRSGFVIMLGMSLHNFPEGLVVSAGYSHLPALGLLVTIMICLHNIPEGIATTTPLISAGMDKKRAIWLTTLSGLTEPIGAIIGSVLISYLGGGNLVNGVALAFASGVMVYVTIDELIPVAHDYCKPIYKHYVSSGVLCGVIFAQLISLII